MKSDTKGLNNDPEVLKPAGKDFLTKLLFENGPCRVILTIAVVLLFCFMPLVASIFNGTFINENIKCDAAHDVGYYVMVIITLFLVFFLPYYFNDLGKAISLLYDTKILNISGTAFKETLDYSNRLFSNWVVTILPYLLAILFTVFGYVSFFLAGKDYWDSSKNLQEISLPTALVSLPRLIYSYLISSFLLRIVLTYFILKKFINENIDIQPLHPDNCGGLSPLGKLSLKISTAGFGIGIPIVINIIWDVYKQGLPLFGYVEMSTILIYLFALVVVFFLPLLGAREGMLKAKNKELKLISDHFQEERKRIILNFNSIESSQDIGISKLEELKKLYDMANAMPVYPFNSKNVIRFFSSILWPILVLFLQYLIQKL
jgi:hypothetical protein